MRNSRGFTLIEVLFALMILTGGILILGNSWSGNFMRIRKSNMYSDVASLLERKMVELEAEYTGHALTEIPETREGDFGSEHKNYKWKMKSRDLKFPDISAIIVGKDGGGADDNILSMIKQMTDIIGKSIKEIKVTVVVKTPRKEMEFSATDYMIDYNTGLAGLPGAGGAPGGAPPQTPPPTGGGGGI